MTLREVVQARGNVYELRKASAFVRILTLYGAESLPMPEGIREPALRKEFR